ncbi:MAG: cytochrome P450 [Chloroflexota bacterium]|nr:cytochrome P450 [Chloroflexota bacterium]
MSLVADLESPAFLADPYPTYNRLRELDPVHWLPFDQEGHGMWLVTRYPDVAATLKDPRLTKDPARFVPEEHLSPLDRSMLFRDPPDHTRLRALVSRAFTPRRVAELEPRITGIASDLLTGLDRDVPVNFITGFAVPLPVIVIAELLGVPPEDRSQFRAWSDAVVGGGDFARPGEESLRRSEEAMAALVAYFADLVAERRGHRRDDLISALLDAQDEDDRLTEHELLGTCILLLIAGHETTVNLLGNGLLALLRHRDQLELLSARPELAPSAVEEMLRYDSPVQRATFRAALGALELGGKEIRPDQPVVPVIGSANRDPAAFPEADRFVIARQPNRHVAFGLGIHFCLGAPLARTEARITFPLLVDLFPNIELAGEPVWAPNTFLRGLSSLPVSLE